MERKSHNNCMIPNMLDPLYLSILPYLPISPSSQASGGWGLFKVPPKTWQLQYNFENQESIKGFQKFMIFIHSVFVSVYTHRQAFEQKVLKAEQIYFDILVTDVGWCGHIWKLVERLSLEIYYRAKNKLGLRCSRLRLRCETNQTHYKVINHQTPTFWLIH